MKIYHVRISCEPESNPFMVYDSNAQLISKHETHAQAWKALDRLQGEPVNKSEERAQWFEKKMLD